MRFGWGMQVESHDGVSALIREWWDLSSPHPSTCEFTGKMVPSSTQPCWLLDLRHLASRTMRNKFPFFKLPSLWYSVTTAWMNGRGTVWGKQFSVFWLMIFFSFLTFHVKCPWLYSNIVLYSTFPWENGISLSIFLLFFRINMFTMKQQFMIQLCYKLYRLRMDCYLSSSWQHV